MRHNMSKMSDDGLRTMLSRIEDVVMDEEKDTIPDPFGSDYVSTYHVLTERAVSDLAQERLCSAILEYLKRYNPSDDRSSRVDYIVRCITGSPIYCAPTSQVHVDLVLFNKLPASTIKAILDGTFDINA